MKKMREERESVRYMTAAWRCGTGGGMAAWRVLQCGGLAGGERENEMRRGRMKCERVTGEVGNMGMGRVD